MTGQWKIDQEALKAFRDSIKDHGKCLLENNSAAKSPYKFAKSIREKVSLKRLPQKKEDVSRAYIFERATDQEMSTLELCIIILAWGGMHGSNLAHLFKVACDPWLNVAKDIREGKLNRSDAFDQFKALQKDGKIKGMGPAYFTKLIYFLMPTTAGAKPRGYIMDQWVSCSVNILANKNIVLTDATQSLVWNGSKELKIKSSYLVSNQNTAENYENFCKYIEDIAAINEIAHLGKNKSKGFPAAEDVTERLLMSEGGINPRKWRKYVMKNRSHDFENAECSA